MFKKSRLQLSLSPGGHNIELIQSSLVREMCRLKKHMGEAKVGCEITLKFVVVWRRSRSRNGSDSQHSISDFVEGGPFSDYMTPCPWQIQDIVESGGAGASGAGPGVTERAGPGLGVGRMQPQGLGQRSPEVIHHLNGNHHYSR